eukprot:TRINITY_DN26311_c0_g1_i2.p1 TRINITY_DN26311_c0_g1~~TRINITY_DN26311_c0_g1_i2.p1  ORF type:complete len:306 (+),score=33.66 TRINITY_DN26311_c0_g1_i2:67-984(+)
MWFYSCVRCFFFFQAEDGIRDAQESRGLGDVYKRQDYGSSRSCLRRMRFLDFCYTAGASWSPRLLRLSGMPDGVLTLAEDPMAMVREKVCQLLWIFKPRLAKEQDSETVDKIGQALGRLKLDDDQSVARAAGMSYVDLPMTEEDDTLEVDDCDSVVDSCLNGMTIEQYIASRSTKPAPPRRPGAASRRTSADKRRQPRRPTTPLQKPPFRGKRNSISHLGEAQKGNVFNKAKALPPIGSGSQTARNSRSDEAPTISSARNVTTTTSAASRETPNGKGPVRLRNSRHSVHGVVVGSSRTRRLPSLH